jgi:hypothetical protein
MEPARDRFKIGDRVVYSLKGLEWLDPRRPDSQGKIVGFSASPYSVRVLWDHRKTPHGLHMDFVKCLPRPSAVA